MLELVMLQVWHPKSEKIVRQAYYKIMTYLKQLNIAKADRLTLEKFKIQNFITNNFGHNITFNMSLSSRNFWHSQGHIWLNKPVHVKKYMNIKK